MNPLIDELTFRSYAHNRMMFPDVQPERWAAIFQNVPAMEERFLKTFIAKLMEAAEEIEVADCATGITSDNGLVGTGVSSSTDGRVDEGQARFAESLSGGSTTPEMAGSRSIMLGRSILRDSVVTCHGDNAALTEQAGTQVPSAGSQSLPVPLGREVSGTVEGHGRYPLLGSDALVAPSENQASPADQILEVAPRQEQPTKEVSHVAGDWSPDLMRPEISVNSSLKAKTGVQSSDCASEIFSCFPLAEIVEKVFKQRSFLCN